MNKLIPLLMFTSLLVACGSDDAPIEGPVAAAVPGTTNATNGCDNTGSGFFINLNCFTLSTTTVDPAVNNGYFTAKWEATTNDFEEEGAQDPVTIDSVKFYLSKDNTLVRDAPATDPSRDLQIWEQSNAAKSGLMGCTFASDNTVTCGTIVGAVDLSLWLSALPVEAYLMARTCTTSPPGTGFNLDLFGSGEDTSTFSSCDTESVLVKFQ